MPRIPINLITWLKREISVEALVLAAGIELKRVGENLVGRCNRHDDNSPSLVVTPEKNLWHCMGACQRGGSVIDWVMFQRDLGFHEAVMFLLETHAPEKLKALTEPKPPRKREKAEVPCPLSRDAEGAVLAREVIDYYHEKGKVSREFTEYLEKRGLNDAELVETFKLGYADRTLGMTLTPSRRKKLQEIGFFRTTGHEHMNGSLTVPVLDENGEVLGCYGRKVRDDLRPGTPDHLYLPGARRGVFNVGAFKASSEMILCESLIDALSFWRHGFRNVTAAYGVEGFTDDILEAFTSNGIERVFIAFDRDEAGDRGAEKVAKKLSAAGIACMRVLFPKGMDANEVSLKMHPAKKTLEFFLRGAEWMCGGSPEGNALSRTAPSSSEPLSSRRRNGEPVEVPGLSSSNSLLPLAAGSLPAAEVSSLTSSSAASGVSGSEDLAKKGETATEEFGEVETLEGSVPVVPEPGEAAKEGRDEDFEPGGKVRPAAKEGSSDEDHGSREPEDPVPVGLREAAEEGSAAWSDERVLPEPERAGSTGRLGANGDAAASDSGVPVRGRADSRECSVTARGILEVAALVLRVAREDGGACEVHARRGDGTDIESALPAVDESGGSGVDGDVPADGGWSAAAAQTDVTARRNDKGKQGNTIPEDNRRKAGRSLAEIALFPIPKKVQDTPLPNPT